MLWKWLVAIDVVVTVHSLRRTSLAGRRIVASKGSANVFGDLDLDTESVTARCLSNSNSAVDEFERGSADLEDERACENQQYPRTCLKSHVPLDAPYGRVKACFRCCLFYWTTVLGLAENFESHVRKGFLSHENDGSVQYEYNLTEVMLSLNSIMKFADVVLTTHLYHWTNPTVDRNGIVKVGERFLLDPDAQQRPCVTTLNSQCVVRDGGVIMARKFYSDSKLFTELSSWAVPGKNVTVLSDRDIANFVPDDYRDLLSSGLRLYRTNPHDQRWEFPLHTTVRSDDDKLFFPIGLFAQLEPRIPDGLLATHRRPFAEKDILFMCKGIRVASEPTNIKRFRTNLTEMLAPHFNCSETHLNASEFYTMVGRAKFVLSPRGDGFNCYRTWEILAAGSIPVVDYHPAFEDLYRGLPVVQVKDWTELTQNFLSGEWTRITEEIQSNKLSHSKAFLPYWIGDIYGRLPAP
jgi:hypothetical protein